MKIAVVLPHISMSPSGGFKVVFEYMNYLAEKGYTIDIFFMSEKFLSSVVKHERFRLFLAKVVVERTPKWFSLSKKINKKVCVGDISPENGYDVMIATSCGTVACVERYKGDCKKIYFIQGYENWGGRTDEEVVQSYGLDMINVTVSKWLYDIVRPYSKYQPICIPNAINTRIFKKEKNILERESHSIVFHYRSAPYKGYKYAIETIKRLKDKYSDLSVNVVGIEKKPDDLPGFCKYYRNIKPEDVAMVNNQSTVFLCTTVDEGFGLPGLEAMACGCCLVSTNYKGVHEYAKHEDNALLSKVKDVDALVENIIRIFEDEALKIQISNSALACAANRTWEKSQVLFEQVIKD